MPNFALAWFIINRGRVFEDVRMNRTLLWWLPPVCLVVNACLNPFIFAFKNDKFTRSLKRLAGRPLRGLLMSKKKNRGDQPFALQSPAVSQGSHNQGMDSISETRC